MKEFDTICGIATPIGEGGISIIRISGKEALGILNNIFRGINNSNILDMLSYTMRYGHIHDVKSNNIIDEVIVSFMKGPRSFTAEDVVEVNCHGGVVATNKVLEEIVKAGCRIAQPGEFTKRAFLNGRIDLSQAEAVMDIIRAKTDLSMKSAVMQSSGHLSREINRLREYLLSTLALIEYSIDFTEDDEEVDESIPINVSEQLNKAINEMEILLKGADEGRIIRDGLNLAIVGKPNVGKSSLLNALLKEKRAIVTDVPGTTRDVIEEYINLDGVPIKIMDTAGIRDTDDIVEKIGVEKSREKIEQADLIVLVIDSSRVLDQDDKEIIKIIKDKKNIVLLNKVDLDTQVEEEELKFLKNIIKISATSGFGIDDLKMKIKELFFSGEVDTESLIISNNRHKQALYKALENCNEAEKRVKLNEYLDLISIYVTSALKALGEITGAELEVDLVNKIFSEFCVGK